MKKMFLFIAAAALTACANPVFSQETEEAEFRRALDSIENAFQWKTGPVVIGENLANLNVPNGWRYLPADQADFVLTDLWGNPPSPSMGMLFPANVSPLDSSTLAFVLSFEDIGFVKDGDADDFNYDDILKDLQKEAEEGNKMRVEAGYDPVKIVGWAANPYYDKEKKVLHWAKDIQFGDDANAPRTLNYDVRVLGRKGVLSMNAVSGMDRVEEVKNQIPAILGSVSFAEGNRYADFDSKVDDVAAWTIGGLVAGKVLAKAGFFALILKFIKPILLVLFAGGAGIWRWITGRKKEEEESAFISETETSSPEVLGKEN